MALLSFQSNWYARRLAPLDFLFALPQGNLPLLKLAELSSASDHPFASSLMHKDILCNKAHQDGLPVRSARVLRAAAETADWWQNAAIWRSGFHAKCRARDYLVNSHWEVGTNNNRRICPAK